MSATFTVAGLKPYDGEYEFDVDAEFTTREWGWIKRLTGYMPLTVEDGFAGGDPELLTMLAVIAIRRSGRIGADEVPALYERFADEALERVVTLHLPPREVEDGSPPARSSDASMSTSGDAGRASSESSAPSTPPATGHPGSAGSLSGPARLAS